MCQEEKGCNVKGYQDHNGLHDQLESPLVLNLVELYWLKKWFKYFLFIILKQENTAYLEDQEHPSDAEADEGAIDEGDHPHQAELKDSYQKGRQVSKGFNA